MREHDFTLILTAEPDDSEAERIYGIVSDGTLSTIAGVPQVHFHRAAWTLEEAISSAIRHLRSAGFHIARIEIEPEALAQTA